MSARAAYLCIVGGVQEGKRPILWLKEEALPTLFDPLTVTVIVALVLSGAMIDQ